MDDRKGKRKNKEHEINESLRESTGSKRPRARATGTYGGGEDGNRSTGTFGVQPVRDNPGQNAPRSAPVPNQPHGRPMGQQPAAAPGGSTPRHGADGPGLQGQAQDSGSRRPQTRVCPVCHNTFFSDAFCVHCSCADGLKLLADLVRPPPLPPQRQQRPPHDPFQYQEMVARRQMGFQRGGAPRGPSAIQNMRPGGLQGSPQAHPVPRANEPLSTRGCGTLMKQPMPIPESRICTACRVNPGQMVHHPWWHVCTCDTCSFKGIVCPDCQLYRLYALAQAGVPAISGPSQPNHQRPPRPQQHPQHPSSIDAGVQQKLQHMAELAAASRPEGERGGAPGGWSPAQLGLPGDQRSPQAHPVPRADKPVGFHYNPVVLGPGPDPEDGWCPACRFYPARTLLQPRRHDCVCDKCRDDDRMMCPLCSSK